MPHRCTKFEFSWKSHWKKLMTDAQSHIWQLASDLLERDLAKTYILETRIQFSYVAYISQGYVNSAGKEIVRIEQKPVKIFPDCWHLSIWFIVPSFARSTANAALKTSVLIHFFDAAMKNRMKELGCAQRNRLLEFPGLRISVCVTSSFSGFLKRLKVFLCIHKLRQGNPTLNFLNWRSFMQTLECTVHCILQSSFLKCYQNFAKRVWH